MKRMPIITAIALALSILLFGCAPAPRQGNGRLTLSVSWSGSRSFLRAPDEINAVTVVLTRQSVTVEAVLTIDQAGGTATGTIEGLYAG